MMLVGSTSCSVREPYLSTGRTKRVSYRLKTTPSIDIACLSPVPSAGSIHRNGRKLIKKNSHKCSHIFVTVGRYDPLTLPVTASGRLAGGGGNRRSAP